MMMRRESVPVAPIHRPEHDALKSLIDRAVDHNKIGSIIPSDILQIGMLGAGAVVAAALFALILPAASSIQHSDFYLVLAGFTGNVAGFMRTIAFPALIFGGCLLLLDTCLLFIRTSIAWRYVVVGQAAVGGAGGGVALLFLGLFLLNLLIWAAIVALALAVLGTFLAALASG